MAVVMVTIVPEVVTMCMTVSPRSMGMATMTEERPDAEGDPGQDQDRPHNVALLGFEGGTEPEPHGGNDAGDDERGDHVPDRREEADAGDMGKRPPLGAGNNGKRNPMIRQDGVQEADGPGSKNEQRNGYGHTFSRCVGSAGA